MPCWPPEPPPVPPGKAQGKPALDLAPVLRGQGSQDLSCLFGSLCFGAEIGRWNVPECLHWMSLEHRPDGQLQAVRSGQLRAPVPLDSPVPPGSRHVAGGRPWGSSHHSSVGSADSWLLRVGGQCGWSACAEASRGLALGRAMSSLASHCCPWLKGAEGWGQPTLRRWGTGPARRLGLGGPTDSWPEALRSLDRPHLALGILPQRRPLEGTGGMLLRWLPRVAGKCLGGSLGRRAWLSWEAREQCECLSLPARGRLASAAPNPGPCYAGARWGPGRHAWGHLPVSVHGWTVAPKPWEPPPLPGQAGGVAAVSCVTCCSCVCLKPLL